MGADARMAGKTKPNCTCSVPGHGMHCEVAREKAERDKGRAREKREAAREIQEEAGPWWANGRSLSTANYAKEGRQGPPTSDPARDRRDAGGEDEELASTKSSSPDQQGEES